MLFLGSDIGTPHIQSKIPLLSPFQFPGYLSLLLVVLELVVVVVVTIILKLLIAAYIVK